MDYLLLACSILCATLNSVFLHFRKGKDSLASAFLFNFFCALVWIIILLPLCGVPTLNAQTLFYGGVYGLASAMFLFFKMQAMSNGPVAITTLIGNCSLVLSTAAGVLLWREKVAPLQVAGVLLLLVALALCAYQKGTGGGTTAKWRFYSFGFFVLAGAVGIILKLISNAQPNALNCVVFISAVFMAVFHFLAYLFCKAKTGAVLHFTKVDYLLAALCGTVGCTYNRLNAFLAGRIESIIFYPLFNGATILLSLLFGFLLFREKITKKQAVGFAVGLAALLLAGNVIRL